MEPRQFFTATRSIIVAGKGGVGKTTVSAALGVAAAGLGLDTLLIEIEGKRGLASLFGVPELRYDDSDLVTPGPGMGRLRGRMVRPEDALADYLDSHGLSTLGRTLSRLHVLDVLAASTPGLSDLLVLGKIKHLVTSAASEVLIVDTPASGHAMSFLQSARGLQEAIDTGPIRRQADEVVEMLEDPASTQVVLVTLAEETPVNELIETAYALEDLTGVTLGPAIVNALLDGCDVPTGHYRHGAIAADITQAASAAATHQTRRCTAQSERVSYLADELPLHQIRIPNLGSTRLTLDHVSTLADLIIDEIEAMPDIDGP